MREFGEAVRRSRGLKFDLGGVESSKEASIGVTAGGEEASESGSPAVEAVRMGENDLSFSGGGISIGSAIGVGAPCTLSSLPGKMKHEKLFRDGTEGVANLVGWGTHVFRLRSEFWFR